MEFGAGVLGSEPPTDGGLSCIAFLLQGCDFLAEGCLVGDAFLEIAANQDAKLDFCHPFSKLWTGLSQMPCFGVWWNSSRFTMGRASAGGNASYREAGPWLFRLSRTTRTTPASG